mgnify:CR=1 FL=1
MITTFRCAPALISANLAPIAAARSLLCASPWSRLLIEELHCSRLDIHQPGTQASPVWEHGLREHVQHHRNRSSHFILTVLLVIFNTARKLEDADQVHCNHIDNCCSLANEPHNWWPLNRWHRLGHSRSDVTANYYDINVAKSDR